MTADFLIPFITVGLAELGDKTQLLILLISSRTKKHLQLLLGVLIAFLIVDGFAVLIGSWVTGMVPVSFLKVSSAIVFIAFGLLKLRDDGKESKNRFCSGSPFLSGFVLIALTEWGDKTQIASGLLATKYSALMVLIGTMTALALLSIMAIWLGRFISSKIDKRTTARIAGIVFILIGILFLLY
jgi:putative Ca2+/H+ antiporter (TMEM165/GDT1 family)